MSSFANPALRRGLTGALALLFLHLPLAPGALPEARAENTMTHILKSSLYGGGLGLLLGAATALVVDSDQRDDALRWGLVLGVFAGFGWGVYSASTGRDDFFHRAGHPTFDPRPYFVGAGVATEPTARPTGLLGDREDDLGARDEFSPWLPAAD